LKLYFSTGMLVCAIQASCWICRHVGGGKNTSCILDEPCFVCIFSAYLLWIVTCSKFPGICRKYLFLPTFFG